MSRVMLASLQDGSVRYCTRKENTCLKFQALMYGSPYMPIYFDTESRAWRAWKDFKKDYPDLAEKYRPMVIKT